MEFIEEADKPKFQAIVKKIIPLLTPEKPILIAKYLVEKIMKFKEFSQKSYKEIKENVDDIIEGELDEMLTSSISGQFFLQQCGGFKDSPFEQFFDDAHQYCLHFKQNWENATPQNWKMLKDPFPEFPHAKKPPSLKPSQAKTMIAPGQGIYH